VKTSSLRGPASDKLRFLAQVVCAEAELLAVTDGRVFSQPMTPQRAASLRQDIDLGERVDAFVARFGRLQDTLADKLLPEILNWLGEPVGPAIDNVARAERLGWISDGQAWFDARQLRNRMIHEYVRDPEVLAAALNAGHATVTLLVTSARTLAALVDA
jgi:hypothetical protein